VVDLEGRLEEVLVQGLFSCKLVFWQHDQVRVPFGIPRVLIFHRIQKQLNLQLDQIKLILVTMHSDFKILLTENVRGNIGHVLNGTLKNGPRLGRIEHVGAVLAQEDVVPEALETSRDRFKSTARVAASVAETV